MKIVLLTAWVLALSLLVGTVAGPSLAGGPDAGTDRPIEACPYLEAQKKGPACPYASARPDCPYRGGPSTGCPSGGAETEKRPVRDLRDV